MHRALRDREKKEIEKKKKEKRKTFFPNCDPTVHCARKSAVDWLGRRMPAPKMSAGLAVANQGRRTALKGMVITRTLSGQPHSSIEGPAPARLGKTRPQQIDFDCAAAGVGHHHHPTMQCDVPVGRLHRPGQSGMSLPSHPSRCTAFCAHPDPASKPGTQQTADRRPPRAAR